MSTFEFKTPVTDEDIRKVHAGDVIYLTGVAAWVSLQGLLVLVTHILV